MVISVKMTKHLRYALVAVNQEFLRILMLLKQKLKPAAVNMQELRLNKTYAKLLLANLRLAINIHILLLLQRKLVMNKLPLYS